MTTEDLIDGFEFMDSWEDTYRHLIELGETLPPLEDKWRPEEWKVKGCQSQVWLVPQIRNGIFHFKGDSDAILVKGIISIVLLIYNDKTAAEIKNIDVTKIFVKLGLEENLTPSRRNGMLSMVEKIKQYAAAA